MGRGQRGMELAGERRVMGCGGRLVLMRGVVMRARWVGMRGAAGGGWRGAARVGGG